MTIATWVKADFNRAVSSMGRDGMNTVFSTRSYTASPSGALLFINHWSTQNRAIVFETGNSSTYHGLETPPGSVANNVWQHLAVTFDRIADTVEFYVDGTQLSAVQSTLGGRFLETFPAYRPMFIGAPGGDQNPLWWHFGGMIDDFRVYDTVLTESQISSLIQPDEAVPEPLTVVSILSGVVGVFGYVRRRLQPSSR